MEFQRDIGVCGEHHSLGVVVAGPFDVPESALSTTIERVMAAEHISAHSAAQAVH